MIRGFLVLLNLWSEDDIKRVEETVGETKIVKAS
jgi:hypothetical protein